MSYKNIPVKPETKHKIDTIKSATGKNYDEIINDLIQKDGIIIDDVIMIDRDDVALTLNYYEHNNTEEIISADVMFSSLKNSDVGTIFSAKEDLDFDLDFVNQSVEIVYKRGDDIILVLTEINSFKDTVVKSKEVIHVNLF